MQIAIHKPLGILGKIAKVQQTVWTENTKQYQANVRNFETQ
jgi:hypothetical protein